MAMPLEGIKVLEVAHAIFGPHAGAQLASMGAEVIKVENMTGGDTTIRGYRGGALPRPGDVNYYFELEKFFLCLIYVWGILNLYLMKCFLKL